MGGRSQYTRVPASVSTRLSTVNVRGSSCFVKESVIRIRAIVILVRVADMEGGGD